MATGGASAEDLLKKEEETKKGEPPKESQEDKDPEKKEEELPPDGARASATASATNAGTIPKRNIPANNPATLNPEGNNSRQRSVSPFPQGIPLEEVRRLNKLKHSIAGHKGEITKREEGVRKIEKRYGFMTLEQANKEYDFIDDKINDLAKAYRKCEEAMLDYNIERNGQGKTWQEDMEEQDARLEALRKHVERLHGQNPNGKPEASPAPQPAATVAAESQATQEYTPPDMSKSLADASTTGTQPVITTNQTVVSGSLGQPTPTVTASTTPQLATPAGQGIPAASNLMGTPLNPQIATPPTPPNLPVRRLQDPEQPTQAYLDEVNKLQNGVFKLYPRVPGTTASEQKKLDSFHEQNMKKLPQLTLKVFSGKEDFDVWLDHFNKIIGSQGALDDTVKMSYLETALSGRAKEDITTFAHGLKKDRQFAKAMEMLEEMYGGELKRQNKAQQRFAQTAPLKNLGFSEVSRIYIALSNLKAFHENEETASTLDSAASADYRDARKKLGKFIDDFDLWVVDHEERSNLSTLHKYIKRIYRAKSHSITRDASDSDNDGMAHYGRSQDKKLQKNSSKKEFNKEPQSQQNKKFKETGVSRSAKSASSKEKYCVYCEMRNHDISYCFKFKDLPPQDRLAFAREKWLKFCCLQNHPGRIHTCDKGNQCSCGQGTHHVLLHDAFLGSDEKKNKKMPFKRDRKSSAKPSREDKKSSDNTEQANHGRNGQAFIQVGQCLIHSGNRKLKANVLVDLGCDHTSIRTDVAQELDMKAIGEPIERKLSVMSGKKIIVPASQLVEFAISASQDTPQFKRHGINYKTKYRIKAYTMPNAVGKCPVADWSTVTSDYSHLKDVDTPFPAKRPVIDLVLGCDYAGLAVALESRSGKPEEPAAHLLKIGWVIFGSTGNKKMPHFRSYKATVIHNEHEENLDHLAKVFSDYHDLDEEGFQKSRQESVGSASKEDKEIPPGKSNSASCDSSELLKEDKALKEKIQQGQFTARKREFNSEVAQAEYDKIQVKELDQGYETTVPWKDGEPELKNNRQAVLERQKKAFAESALKKKDVTIDDLKAVVEDHLEKKYIRKLSKAEEMQENCHYLPIIPVVNKERKTTPVRLVYDAAATYNGKSLNSEQVTGPNLLNNFLQIIMRFRRFKFCLTGDISQMFLRMRLAEKDRAFHRFLFGDPKTMMEAFEFLRTLFGGKSTPNASQKVLHCVVEDHGSVSLEAAVTIIMSCYMDDCIDSRMDEEEVIQLRKELVELLSHADMVPRKFSSNSKAVLATIPEEDRAKEISLVNSELTSEDNKVLGVIWSPVDDMLKMRGTPLPGGKTSRRKHKTRDGETVWTLRTVLSVLFKIYDPIGIVGAFTIKGKIILQLLMCAKTGWDVEICEKYKKMWIDWLDELNDMEDIRVHRHLGFAKDTKFVLVCCVDASLEAICAVFYVRSETLDGTVSVRFLMGKCKVTPTKALSVPRLELLAATLGADLSVSIRKYLGGIKKIKFFTDSTDVLFWLNQPSKMFKPFIANRAGLIQRMTHIPFWYKIHTSINPADIGSRGATVKSLAPGNLYHDGPPFLLQPEEEWGERFDLNRYTVAKHVAEEQRPFLSMKATEDKEEKSLDDFLDATKLSTGKLYDGWEKLRGRVMNLLKIRQLCTKSSVSPRNELLEKAENILLKRAQQQSYGEVLECLSDKKKLKKKGLNKLTPFLDEDGMMRSKSRLEYAKFMSFEARNPLILDSRNPIVKLYVSHAHQKMEHPVGKNALRALLMKKCIIQKFYLIERRLPHSCPECVMKKSKIPDQQQAPLPTERFDANARPFTNTGMDFLGPFKVRLRRATRHWDGEGQVYILLLTCYTTRAVHLEVTPNMKTITCFNAIFRFCDRRGVPHTMYSDNQTSFVALNNELQMLYQELDFKKLQKLTEMGYKESRGISWRFNTPLAPHHGGAFEIHVKAVKRALQAVNADTGLDYDDFITSVTNAERLINSRPLTLAKVESSDEVRPLCANDFLIGKDTKDLSPATKANPPLLGQRWRRLQELRDHFWSRYLKEVLPQLYPRLKSQDEKHNLEPGTLVLEVDPKMPRGTWQVAKVDEVKVSRDGLVRTVTITTMKNKATYKRAVQRVIPLEFQEL